MNNKIKIGYVGSGPISHFHIPALQKAGFKIETLYSRKNSKRLLEISKSFKLVNPETDLESFILNSIKKKVTAFVIAIKTEATLKMIKVLSKTGKLILSEKPGSINYRDLLKIKKHRSKIFFAYNRRFYDSIAFAKKFVKNNSNCNVDIRIPDSIPTWHQFVINGCHVIDLVRFLFKDVKLLKKYHLNIKSKNGSFFILKSKNEDYIKINLNWGFPDNFSINIFSNGKRVEICPLEVANYYEKMEIKHPTKDFPLRLYVPQKKKIISPKKNFELKPGFYEQYIDFKKKILIKNHKSNLCTFNEAVENLKLINYMMNKNESINN